MIKLLPVLCMTLLYVSCDRTEPSNPVDLMPPAPVSGVKALVSSQEPGYETRDLKLPDVKGGEFILSSLKGKYVFLDFWATWCGPCIQAIPALNTLEERFGPKGFAVVGVSVDDEKLDTIAKFASEKGMKYRVLLGEDGHIDRFGKSRGLPTAFLLDRDGRVIRKFVGEHSADQLISAVASVVESEPTENTRGSGEKNPSDYSGQ